MKQDYLSEEKPADREVSRLFLAFSSSILNPQFILNRCIIMLKAHQYYIINYIYTDGVLFVVVWHFILIEDEMSCILFN